LYEAWAKWGRHPVPGSRLTIAGLQQLACRTWVKDGEFLSRIRGRQKADMPGLPPIMIEPLDAGQLPVEKTEQVGNGLNRIIGSVEIDALGEVAAYHVLNEAPGSLFSVTAGAYTTQRIVAAQMIHLFRQEDAGQLRGISLLAPIVKSIYLHDQYHEAVQVGAAVANDMSIVVNRRDVDDGGVGDGGPLPPSQARDASGNPEVDDEGRPVFEMGPGLVYQASPDETITVNKPTAPQGVSDYVRVVLKEIAAGVGLSYYTLTGDMSDASFSQAKLGLLEQGAVIACLREQTYIPGFLAPLWKAWIDAGILNGIFPNDPRLYDVTWSKPKTRSADELQDAKSNLLRLQMGLTTPTAVVEANGDDLDDILAQFKKDREAMEDAGVVPLWDLSKVSAAGNAQIIASDASESGPPPKGGGL
jgi:lambda family phage portal protein